MGRTGKLRTLHRIAAVVGVLAVFILGLQNASSALSHASNTAISSRVRSAPTTNHLHQVSVFSGAIAPLHRTVDKNASSLGTATAGPSSPSTLVGRASSVPALIVGCIALLALMYLVLIFSRRRISTS
jgi:hypothetical protein